MQQIPPYPGDVANMQAGHHRHPEAPRISSQRGYSAAPPSNAYPQVGSPSHHGQVHIYNADPGASRQSRSRRASIRHPGAQQAGGASYNAQTFIHYAQPGSSSQAHTPHVYSAQPGPSNQHAADRTSGGMTFGTQPVANPSGLSRLFGTAGPSNSASQPTAQPLYAPAQHGSTHPMHTSVHYTHVNAVGSIHDHGIKPGYEGGIGTPEGGHSTNNGFFVKNPGRGYLGDETAYPIGVLSRNTAQPDHNYAPHPTTGEYPAGFFSGSAPPLRDAAHVIRPVHSYTRPMTPTTRAGAAAYESARQGRTVSPETAERTITDDLRSKFPFDARLMEDPEYRAALRNRGSWE